MRVNSPGGSVFDGTTIYNALRQHKSKVIAYVDGLAASIASVIVMAADEIVMGEGSYMMIHEPWSIAIGNYKDMHKEGDLLEKVGGSIADTYMNRSNKEEAEILDLMEAETWFTAEEAVENGFADRVFKVEKEKKAKAQLFDLTIFNNVPDDLKEKRVPTQRDLEKMLREVGLSHSQAKGIIANGYTAILRDEEEADQALEVRDEPVAVQRDVEQPVVVDRVALLIERAEKIAPAKNYNTQRKEYENYSTV